MPARMVFSVRPADALELQKPAPDATIKIVEPKKA
jgi:hypothetical protein